MEKIKLDNLKVKEMLDFLTLANIDAPQTMMIGGGDLSFRAYPKSKAFIKAKKEPIGKFCEQPKELDLVSYKWPIANMTKLIAIFGLFKDKKTTAHIFVDAGFVVKMTLESDKKDKVTVISGDLAHVPEWLEDAVWNRLSDTSTAECSVKFDAGDITNLKKTYHVMHGVSTATKNLQRLVFVKATKDGLMLASSNEGDEAKKNEWSITWSDEYANKGMDSDERILNLSNIMNLTSSGVMYIKPHSGGLKAMVIETDITVVNIITPKS